MKFSITLITVNWNFLSNMYINAVAMCNCSYSCTTLQPGFGQKCERYFHCLSLKSRYRPKASFENDELAKKIGHFSVNK